MNKLFFSTLCLVISLSVAAQINELTLQQSVETAFANNPVVKQNEFLLQAAGVSLSQSRSNLIPRVNGNINHYLNQGRSIDPANNGYVNQQNTTANYSLSSDVTLFNGFLLKYSILVEANFIILDKGYFVSPAKRSSLL